MKNELRLARLKELKFMMQHHEEIFGTIENIRFNMDKWAYGKLEHQCMTAACALGSAAMYPPFTAEGLGLSSAGPTGMVPEFEGYTRFEAGRRFFGIHYEESEFLFDPTQYRHKNGTLIYNITIRQVIRHIDVLIRKYSHG